MYGIWQTGLKAEQCMRGVWTVEYFPNSRLAGCCSIALHVNCKIAVFVNIQVITMAKTGTKVKNQVLINILHCSVDHKMVLRAEELAPSGIMLVILSLKMQVLTSKAKLSNLAPKRVWPRP